MINRVFEADICRLVQIDVYWFMLSLQSLGLESRFGIGERVRDPSVKAVPTFFQFHNTRHLKTQDRNMQLELNLADSRNELIYCARW